MQAEFDKFPNPRRIEHRHHRSNKGVLTLVRETGRLAVMVVRCDNEDTTVFGRSRDVAVIENVAATVHPRTLSVPEGEHTVDRRIRVEVDHLGAPYRRSGQLFIQAWNELDLVFGDKRPGSPEFLVDSAER
jgi:hypothetical protein